MARPPTPEYSPSELRTITPVGSGPSRAAGLVIPAEPPEPGERWRPVERLADRESKAPEC
jgi:hypothetical protein